MKITIMKNGPYVVDADIPVKEADSVASEDGGVQSYAETRDLFAATHLCRCGHSANKPLCDGQHVKVGFDGTETNSRKHYDDEAELLRGAVYDALDAPALCTAARFCDVGIGFWDALGEADEASQAYVEHVGCTCSSGRLTLVEKDTGRKLEPELEKEVCLVRDVPENHYGPVYVKGGIAVVGSDGFAYEVRNRVSLCRCGESKNKPFCDGAHLECKHMELE